VRIRVAAAALNPIDLSTRAGRLADAGLMSPAPTVGLGWDVAGTVDAVGDGVRRFDAGDAVIGLRDLLFAGGTHADLVVLHENAVAPAPRSVDPTAAATLPLNGLTADGALRATGVGPGDSLLVTGASGGVGGFVVQLAAARGVRTVALVRAGDEERVRRLGAETVVTDAGALGQEVRATHPTGVDAVVDAAIVGIDAHAALRDAGTFVALVRPFAPPPIRGTHVVVHEVHADGARLTELAALVDFGVLTTRVAATVPLEDAADAHRRLDAGGVPGRLVLVP
jgi:NADPH:quinone reductase-like Zn-dependent oxidoreductase